MNIHPTNINSARTGQLNLILSDCFIQVILKCHRAAGEETVHFTDQHCIQWTGEGTLKFTNSQWLNPLTAGAAYNRLFIFY